MHKSLDFRRAREVIGYKDKTKLRLKSVRQGFH